MIDLIINTIMLVGIVTVSVPVLFFACVGLVHVVYGTYKLIMSDLT